MKKKVKLDPSKSSVNILNTFDETKDINANKIVVCFDIYSVIDLNF